MRSLKKLFITILAPVAIFAMVQSSASPIQAQQVQLESVQTGQSEGPAAFGGIHLEGPDEVVVWTGRRFEARWTVTSDTAYINILIYNSDGENVVTSWVEVSDPVGTQGIWIVPDQTGWWYLRVELVSGDNYELLDTQTKEFEVVGKVYLPYLPPGNYGN